MISIRSSADMARALEGPLDARLRGLLEQRRDQLMEHEGYDLGELAHFIVVQRGDTRESVEAEAGIPLSTEDGPLFEFVERHGSWLEAVVILSDDGFGVALFAADCICTDASLLRLLRSQL